MIAENNAGSSWSRADSLMLGGILLATFLLYAPALGYQFVYDDRVLILHNPQLLSWRFIPDFFRENFPSSAVAGAASVYYRPVLLVWMLINAKIWGMSPPGWHLTAIVLHLIVIVEVYVLARRLLKQPLPAALAAAVVALHPLHVECVAWVMAMAEQLAASLLLGSFLAYLSARANPRRRKAWLAVSLGLFALAVLVKENMIVLPGLVLAYEWLFNPRPDEQERWRRAAFRARGAILAAVPYFATAFAYLAIRIAVLKSLGQAVTPMSLSTHLATLPGVLLSYLKILFWPVGLSVEYDTPYVHHVTFVNFLLPAAAVAVFIALLGVWSLRSRAAAFAAIWLGLPLLPVLDLPVFPRDEIVHDRYLYFPSIGFALLLALVFAHFAAKESRRRAVLRNAAAVTLIALLAAGTLYYRPFWSDNLTLFTRAVEIAPQNPTALNNAGNEFVARGDLQKGLAFYQRALAADPSYWLSASNAGYIAYRLGRFPEAERYLLQAIALSPYDSMEYMRLGMTYLKMGRLNEAEAAVRQAITLQPEGRGYHLALGVILAERNELKEALEEFHTEHAAFPDEEAASREIEELSRRISPVPNPASHPPVP
jgi:protein O-mannosyl-transferase